MTRPIKINITPAHEAKCVELGNQLHAYPLDVLDAVLRDPELQADFGALVDRALDKHLTEQRAHALAQKQGPRPIAWPTTQKAAPGAEHTQDGRQKKQL